MIQTLLCLVSLDLIHSFFINNRKHGARRTGCSDLMKLRALF